MKNYKTTIAALVGYAVILINKYAGHEVIPNDVAVGLVICIVALFTKDYDTTGTGYSATKN